MQQLTVNEFPHGRAHDGSLGPNLRSLVRRGLHLGSPQHFQKLLPLIDTADFHHHVYFSGKLPLPSADVMFGSPHHAARWHWRRARPCRRSRRDEVASVLRVPEPGEAGEAALEGGRLELAHAGGDEAAQVDHGALVAHRHPAPHREGARQELDDQRLHLQDS